MFHPGKKYTWMILYWGRRGGGERERNCIKIRAHHEGNISELKIGISLPLDFLSKPSMFGFYSMLFFLSLKSSKIYFHTKKQEGGGGGMWWRLYWFFSVHAPPTTYLRWVVGDWQLLGNISALHFKLPIRISIYSIASNYLD